MTSSRAEVSLAKARPGSRWVWQRVAGADRAGDLASHGDWYETPAYGAVWFPRNLPADWGAVPLWQLGMAGAVGLDLDRPLTRAFAPFFITGGGACFRGAWGSAAGLRVQRPVYAPALVAWSDPVVRGRPPVQWPAGCRLATTGAP